MIKRPNRITARFSKEEHEFLLEQADIAALTVSEYIRRRTLDRRVASKLDLRVLAEVRRLGGLLKLVHVESGGAYSGSTASAVKAVNKYLRAAAKKIEKGLKEV